MYAKHDLMAFSDRYDGPRQSMCVVTGKASGVVIVLNDSSPLIRKGVYSMFTCSKNAGTGIWPPPKLLLHSTKDPNIIESIGDPGPGI
jgi:hypothetical protein